jgi:hypothetical protein
VRGRQSSRFSRVLPDRCRVLPGKITAQGAVQWPGSSIGNSHRGTALTLSRGHPMASQPGPQGHQARGPEAARQSYALRGGLQASTTVQAVTSAMLVWLFSPPVSVIVQGRC